LAIEVHCGGGAATSVTVLDALNERHEIFARQFVIACNGIDSCLLLQRSTDVPKHASLGRYYMDHPVFDLAIHGFGFDAKPGYGDSAQTGMITAFFEEVAPNLPVSLLGEVKCATMANNAGEGNRDAILYDIIRRGVDSRGWRMSLREAFRSTWNATLDLWFLVETQPLEDNTVSIGAISPSGQAIPEISLRYPTYLPQCIEYVTAYIRQRMPGAEVRLHSTYPGSHHWLGATRMADSVEMGCVDRDLRYYGLDNLFVLSGSTFPSSSSANPTLTLAALALRLGDFLGEIASAAIPGGDATSME
jgi:hypothetical protein